MNFTPVLNENADKCGMTQIIVVAESELGEYQPITIAASPDEASVLCASHYKHADRDNDMCPHLYRLFARDGRGQYIDVGHISDLSE